MKATSNFDFDQLIDRRNTNSIKWDTASSKNDSDVLPFWVADMDFEVPPQVKDAVREAAEHGIYGYCGIPDSALECVADWTKRRYHWSIEPSWLSYTSGVITGLNIVVQTFTRPGESVIIQPPVYPPFHASARLNGRNLVYNDLAQESSGRYIIDFDRLRSQITPTTKLLVLCNPHNPVGREWSIEELTTLASIAEENDLLVFSDEIHADLMLPPHRHTSFASISPETARRTITGIAPSKTFNIAGLKASIIITPNDRLRAAFDAAQEKTFGLYHANTFAVPAMEAAYRHGERWLDELMLYLRDNAQHTVDVLRKRASRISITMPEATFLLWLGFSDTGLSHEVVKEKLLQDARVLLNDGRSFGPGGENYFRFNFGCPRSVLDEGIERIVEVFGD